ncbi:MAG TPA: bile acid:sodium symporter family protein [Xanthobacteraceae bacterium]|jgi:sodium/bile acid cotransporter 7|nr:bile acid:sodium symporter family protein [Xanthobacteraceae bacterium]
MSFVRALLRIDRFLAAILLTVALASFLPVRGEEAAIASWLTGGGIMLLFLLHGARLSPEAVLAGARHWRLHAVVFSSTFVLFPLLVAACRLVAPDLLPAPLWAGFILLGAAPSTLQASIAFTSLAGGNVSAALCSASASNVLGTVLAPLIVGLLLAHTAPLTAHAILAVGLQLVVPFLAGQMLRPWIGGFLSRHALAVKSVDYGSILLIVYTTFSAGVVNGIWHQVDAAQLMRVALLDAALLAIVMTILTVASRALSFSRADEIAIVFCGSKKSLATGASIATVLFGGHAGLAILPIMLFHQIQLMVCAWLARRCREGEDFHNEVRPAGRLAGLWRSLHDRKTRRFGAPAKASIQ